MGVPSFSAQGSLFSTAALGASLFAPDDRYRLFAQRIYPQLMKVRPHLEKAYSPDTGRTALEPVLLLGVSLLQYLDGTPDRQAVELLRYHAGWNFALNRQLGETLFHPSSLCRFRDRLQAHGLAAVGFQSVLDALIEAGLVKRQSAQRLDSTQVFGLVSKMSRVEMVRQSLRLALEELEPRLPERPEEWSRWWSQYVEGELDYRASREVLGHKLADAGRDARGLLDWLAAHQPQHQSGEQTTLLARIWKEQFVLEASQVRARGKGELDSDRVQNPFDPEATYAVKNHGGQPKSHVGYKAQVAETVVEAILEKGEPTQNFLTALVIQPAHHGDEAGAQKVEEAQAQLGLEPPPVQYLDGAYLSAQRLVEAAAAGRELIGPVQSAPPPDPQRLTVEEFQIEVEQRRAVCPAGRPNDQCSRLESEQGRVQFRFEWNTTTCGACALRESCLGKNQRQRSVVVGEHHSALQARRQEQKTEAFRRRMRHRNAIEGTQSELVRAHGLRRARYRGLSRVQLQGWFTAAACNIKRWLRRCAWTLQKTAAAIRPNPAAALG